MTTYSNSGFSGGTKASPAIAPFPQGLTSRAGHGFLTGATAQILDADSPEVIRIVSPSTAINQDLPTTGVKAGRRFMLVVSGATEANYVALRSSGGNEIDRIGGAGFILVQALINTPTTAAHWEILDVQEYSELVISGITGAVTTNMTAILTRRKYSAVGYFKQTLATATATASISIPGGGIPARFRPTTGQWTPCVVHNSGQKYSGIARVATDGSIAFLKYDASNFVNSSGVDETTTSWNR